MSDLLMSKEQIFQHAVPRLIIETIQQYFHYMSTDKDGKVS